MVRHGPTYRILILRFRELLVRVLGVLWSGQHAFPGVIEVLQGIRKLVCKASIQFDVKRKV